MASNQSLPPILFKVGDRVRVSYVPGAVINISVGMSGTVISQPQIVARMVQVEVRLDDGKEIWWPQENLERIDCLIGRKPPNERGNQPEVEEYLLETPQALGLGPELVQNIPDSPTFQFKNLDPCLLKPHPQNPEIYGADEDIEDLIEAISRSGWLKRVVITPNGQIISGHRRVRAAIALLWPTVPVEVRQFDSELEELEALLLENQYRFKTNEQKVREGMMWERVEQEKAKIRLQESAKSTNEKLALFVEEKDNTGSANLRYPSTEKKVQNRKNKSAYRAANKVSMKERTYQKARKVVENIDRLSVTSPEVAKDLRLVLNEKSIDAAYKKVKKMELNENTQESQVENPPEFPHPAVGEIVQIWLRNRTDPELNVYHKQVGIVDRIAENSVIVKVWNKEIPPLFFDEVKPAPQNINMCVNLPQEMVKALMLLGYESSEVALVQSVNAYLAPSSTPSSTRIER